MILHHRISRLDGWKAYKPKRGFVAAVLALRRVPYMCTCGYCAVVPFWWEMMEGDNTTVCRRQGTCKVPGSEVHKDGAGADVKVRNAEDV